MVALFGKETLYSIRAFYMVVYSISKRHNNALIPSCSSLAEVLLNVVSR